MKHNWEYKKLGDTCTFERGITYDKSDESNNPTDIRILRSNNISLDTYSLNLDEIRFLDSNFKINPNKIIKKDSILICMSNGSFEHLGKVAFIDKDYNYGFGGFMGLLKPNNIYPKYLFYILRSPVFINFLNSVNRGVNIRNLQFSKMSNLSIPVPPMDVQEQIVAELDKLNELIATRKEQLKELDNLAQSLFYDTFGDPVSNPKGWKRKTYGELFNVSSGGTPSTKENKYWENGTIPWIGSNMCNNSILYKTDGKFITELGLNNSSAKILYPGTTLIAMVGATIGKTAFLSIPLTTNQNVAAISLKDDSLFTPMFIFYNSKFLYPLFKEIGGDKFTIASLSFIRSLPIIQPPFPLQQQFAAQVEAIERQKELVEASIVELQTLLDSRMDYWFN